MLGEFLSNGWIKYLPMFLVGVALYHLHNSKWVKIRSAISFTSEIGVLTLAVSLPASGFVLTGFSELGLQNLRYVFDVPLSLLATSLLFFALSRGRILKNLLSLKWLQFLGDISFSLYLLHAPVILLGLYLSNFNILIGLACLVVSIPLSFVAFKLVEKPVQNLSRKIRSNSMPTTGKGD
jgi:peptidoglycan/LPS O-acetylase OafA/YrhL